MKDLNLERLRLKHYEMISLNGTLRDLNKPLTLFLHQGFIKERPTDSMFEIAT